MSRAKRAGCSSKGEAQRRGTHSRPCKGSRRWFGGTFRRGCHNGAGWGSKLIAKYKKKLRSQHSPSLSRPGHNATPKPLVWRKALKAVSGPGAASQVRSAKQRVTRELVRHLLRSESGVAFNCACGNLFCSKSGCGSCRGFKLENKLCYLGARLLREPQCNFPV